jgi:hypothetical protein
MNSAVFSKTSATAYVAGGVKSVADATHIFSNNKYAGIVLSTDQTSSSCLNLGLSSVTSSAKINGLKT